MTLASTTSSTVSTAPAADIPAAPPDDLAPLKLPPNTDLDKVESIVRHAEDRLELWFIAVTNPSIEQLDVATLALWRITAVHKTLCLYRKGKYSKKPSLPLPKEFLHSIRVMEETLNLLHPPKPKAPKPKTPPVPPFPPLTPGMPPLLPLPTLPPLPRTPFPPLHPPQRTPKPEPQLGVAPKPKSDPFERPRPVAECPELRNPMHSAQAAARQADKLCQEAGLPDPEPTPEAPAPAPTKPESSAPEPEPTSAPDSTYKPYTAYQAYKPYSSVPTDPIDPTDPNAPICPSPFLLCPSNRPPPT